MGDAPRVLERRSLGSGPECVAAEVIREHAFELGCAAGIHPDLRAALLYRLAERPHVGIVEDQPIQPDLGIEDELQVS